MKDFLLNVKGKFIAKVKEKIEFHGETFTLRLKTAPTTNIDWASGGSSPEDPDVKDPGTIPSRKRPVIPDPAGKDSK